MANQKFGAKIPGGWRCVCRVLGTLPYSKGDRFLSLGPHWPCSGGPVQPPALPSCVTEPVGGRETQPHSLQRKEVWKSLGCGDNPELWGALWWRESKAGSWELAEERRCFSGWKGDGAFGAQLWFCSLCKGRQAGLMIMDLSLMKNMGYSTPLRNQVQNYNMLRKACLWRFTNEKQIKEKGQLRLMSCVMVVLIMWKPKWNTLSKLLARPLSEVFFSL